MKVTFRTKEPQLHEVRDLENGDPATETFATAKASESGLQTQVNERLEELELAERHHHGNDDAHHNAQLLLANHFS